MAQVSPSHGASFTLTWRRFVWWLAQVCHASGTGLKVLYMPAPRFLHIRFLLAPVCHLKSSLYQPSYIPEPPIQHTCSIHATDLHHSYYRPAPCISFDPFSEGNGRLFRELPKLLEKPGVAAPLRIEGLWCRVTTLLRPAHCVYCAGLGWNCVVRLAPPSKPSMAQVSPSHGTSLHSIALEDRPITHYWPFLWIATIRGSWHYAFSSQNA